MNLTEAKACVAGSLAVPLVRWLELHPDAPIAIIGDGENAVGISLSGFDSLTEAQIKSRAKAAEGVYALRLKDSADAR